MNKNFDLVITNIKWDIDCGEPDFELEAHADKLPSTVCLFLKRSVDFMDNVEECCNAIADYLIDSYGFNPISFKFKKMYV